MKAEELLVEVDVDKGMMRGLTPSTSSMKHMLTSITQTLVKLGLVMRMVTLRESTLLLFLMVGYSM